jgi:hypothetical protein
MPFIRRSAAVALLVVAAAMTLTGCNGDESAPSQSGGSPTTLGFDGAAAVAIARDYVVQGQPSGYVFIELTNSNPRLVGDRWSIKVDARIRIPQEPPQESALHYIIEVDRVTGTPTIVAQS